MDASLAKLIADEGNEADWTHAGLACAIRRTPSLQHWCGYVAVPEGHPAHGKDYDAVDVAVHGGLTYAAAQLGRNPSNDGLFWLGFDCAHSGDLVPGMGAKRDLDVYRTAAWVREETNRLAEQLAEMAAQ